MDKSNHTVTEFILLGFTADPVMQVVLFVMFFGVYSMTVLGNTTLIVLIFNDSRLHTPMYFFIWNLSFLDFWYPSVYIPKILMICISEDKSISFAGCVAQFFFSAGLGYSECYLLAAMAYDRYVAISKPLLYSQAMPIKLCAFLVAASYLGGFINSSIITKKTFTMNFCNDNTIDDFFCDLLPLVKLACGRKDGYQALMYFLLTSNVITPSALILASYLFIITTILKIRSTQGRFKAFSTCFSHLISVTLYYGSILYIYARPRSSYSLDRDKIVSTFYTVVFPMLNPMIYSLRNKDVKEALSKLFK
ncbi:Olfactory receptor 9G9 [Camelus dromedarius]|uniref:Olfactory receptor n=1 Tax=Camelus dromedarius TaxID=9838 RepID=A0A5N4DM60_CAMDR|nr:olfactory receptor 1013 [Camelus dromedarius]KAB1272238.1 Olfactory receptor 9G9 [Camelus dromedarius]